MSPRTEKQYEDIREERREQIKRVALEIISEEGFQNTSISKIARKAKISKGLMYNYFDSKESMIKEILLDGMKNFSSAFDPNRDGLLTDEEMKFFIDETFNILQSNIHYWRLYFSTLFQPKIMEMVYKEFMEWIEPLFRVAYGYFARKGIKNPEVETRMMAAMLDGICMNYVMDPENFPLTEIKNRLYELLNISSHES